MYNIIRNANVLFHIYRNKRQCHLDNVYYHSNNNNYCPGEGAAAILNLEFVHSRLVLFENVIYHNVLINGIDVDCNQVEL